jgi:hypothetical protein
MTGSYFRGDAEAILDPVDESKFETVTYTYYEQLNGYPKPIRLERLMLMLQGYADDSGSDGRHAPYFFGGFLMEAERWAHFADAWQTQLDRSPAIEYFKMHEAHTRSGQFTFIQPEIRDRKVKDLLEVIEAFKPVGIYSTVNWEEFRVSQIPYVEGAAKDPYHCLVPWLFDVVREWQVHNDRFPEPVDFDFDEQGEKIGAAIHAVYPEVKRTASQSLRKMLGRIPMMLDDKKVLPLQAADMLVWNLRAYYEPKLEYSEWEWLYARLNALCFGGAFGPGTYNGLQIFSEWQSAIQRLGL